MRPQDQLLKHRAEWEEFKSQVQRRDDLRRREQNRYTGTGCEVFCLVDPFTDKIRYVGITSIPNYTRRSFTPGRAGSGSKMKKWIQDLHALGEIPRYEIMGQFGDDNQGAQKFKKKLILDLTAAGEDLLNRYKYVYIDVDPESGLRYETNLDLVQKSASSGTDQVVPASSEDGEEEGNI